MASWSVFDNIPFANCDKDVVLGGEPLGDEFHVLIGGPLEDFSSICTIFLERCSSLFSPFCSFEVENV